MRSSAVLPRPWDEVLDRMEQTVEQNLSTQRVPGSAASPVPPLRVIFLTDLEHIDRVIDQAEQRAAEVDAVLQDDAADFSHWLAACSEVAQKLAECLARKVE